MLDRSSSKVIHSSEVAALSINQESCQNISTEDADDSIFIDAKLSATASLNEIFEAMRNPTTGITFIAKLQSLPSYTFVSHDAITWLQHHIEGQCNPIEILERMRR